MSTPKTKEYTTHHWKPKSRGGDDKTTVKLPAEFHRAWHALFQNLYGSEIIYFLTLLAEEMRESEKVTSHKISEIRSKAKEGG